MVSHLLGADWVLASKFGGGETKCVLLGKASKRTVNAAETISAEETYHGACFKCSECAKKMTPSGSAKFEEKLLCTVKPCIRSSHYLLCVPSDAQPLLTVLSCVSLPTSLFLDISLADKQDACYLTLGGFAVELPLSMHDSS